MGTFTYGPTSIDVTLDDRLLAHLRTVVVTKLRRGECFLFTWTDDTGPEPVEESLWMHPAVAMRFRVEKAAAESMNQDWLAVLMHAANSGSGLTTRPEPVPAPGSRPGDAAQHG
ncbi:ATP-dependent DNA ligase [uncultured Frigoribacterium sp.]|uniref:DUF7882 family protein n=1 Tax=uncultured Frigoribacterium sp. TaxID=335377 RepID=UPI0028D74F1F|nr:ATP-dependent DNA ligase [uncultured Frigoribacterium sp.]